MQNWSLCFYNYVFYYLVFRIFLFTISLTGDRNMVKELLLKQSNHILGTRVLENILEATCKDQCSSQLLNYIMNCLVAFAGKNLASKTWRNFRKIYIFFDTGLHGQTFECTWLGFILQFFNGILQYIYMLTTFGYCEDIHYYILGNMQCWITSYD